MIFGIDRAAFVVLVFIGSLCSGMDAIADSAFTDDFSSYTHNTCFSDGTNFGPWTSAFSGFGCVKLLSNGTQNWLDESPQVSTNSSDTHSALVLGPSFSNPLTFSVNVNTTAQLRQNSQPNAWEVGWVIWHYADDDHFYYFIAKPDGWELGKKEPGAQRFLAMGDSPTFPIGNWYNIRIATTAQDTITVYVNNQLMTTFTDTQNPYTSGRIGLYDEDAHVRFTNVAVTGDYLDLMGECEQYSPTCEWESRMYNTNAESLTRYCIYFNPRARDFAATPRRRRPAPDSLRNPFAAAAGAAIVAARS